MSRVIPDELWDKLVALGDAVSEDDLKDSEDLEGYASQFAELMADAKLVVRYNRSTALDVKMPDREDLTDHAYEDVQGICTEDVHGWFGLTYASYLTWPRVLMQLMPADWQHRFLQLAREIDEVFDCPIQSEDREAPRRTYEVRVRDARGRWRGDPLREYRHPNWSAIREATDEAYIDEVIPAA